MVDLLITGGLVVDGTGSPPFHADVAVTKGIITAVGNNLDLESTARRTIDATGHIVTPGECKHHA